MDEQSVVFRVFIEEAKFVLDVVSWRIYRLNHEFWQPDHMISWIHSHVIRNHFD